MAPCSATFLASGSVWHMRAKDIPWMAQGLPDPVCNGVLPAKQLPGGRK